MGDKGKELVDKLIALKSEGKVAFETFDGLYISSIEDLIYKQPGDGLLYDLNRDAPTCLTWIAQEKESWVNNYAAGLVIEKLYADVLSARAEYEAMQRALGEAKMALFKASGYDVLNYRCPACGMYDEHSTECEFVKAIALIEVALRER